ncbi:Spy0128 family protein [Lacrimispora sp.]|uniref:Spy0128 family protein n=1 Tax=Lacrimispora sp. TaxID=2719234 RepID=UPI00289CA966|nr:FctA domain-containing protein [Lacrimispora sp.]
MNSNNKVQNKWITVRCLLLFCLLVIGFPLNVHAEANPVAVTLYVEQVFIKNSSASDVNHVFSYDLISLDTGNPMPQGSLNSIYSFTAAGTGVKDIDPITFSNTGIYRYEIKGNQSVPARGYSYDSQVYSVTVYVKQTGANLSAEIVVNKSDGSKAGSIRFENTYTPLASNPEIMVDPPVKKTVSGNPSTASSFTFSLTAQDKDNPMPEGSADGIKHITIYGSGEVDFGTWIYTREGTYFYTISEVILSDTRYTYDRSVYTITDVVKDIDGQLVVTRIVTNDAYKQVESCIFINKYIGGGESSGSGGTGSSGGPGRPGVSGSSNGPGASGNDGGPGPVGGLRPNGVPAFETGFDNSPGSEAGGGSNAAGVLSVPKTGDEINGQLYEGMLWGASVVATGSMIYLILAARRRKKETELSGKMNGDA